MVYAQFNSVSLRLMFILTTWLGKVVALHKKCALSLFSYADTGFVTMKKNQNEM